MPQGTRGQAGQSGDGHSQHRAVDVRVATVVVMYALSSLSGVFVNKACLSAFNFRFTITLMLLQLIVSVSALSALRITRVISIPRRTVKELSLLIYPAVFLIANVTVGLLALRLVNIPMFSAFRRLSVLNVMILEYFVLGRTASRRILFTVFIMVIGSFLAGLGDLTYDPFGYFLVFLNNFITGANLVSIKKASTAARLEALALNYYVSVIALPIVLVLAVFTGELHGAMIEIYTRKDLQTFGFAFALSLSAASAFLVNFFTNLCTQLTSPLTTAITGQMKNVLQTLLGIFAWGYRVSVLNLEGLATALAGSLWFAYYKYDDARAARAISSASTKKSILVNGNVKDPSSLTDDEDEMDPNATNHLDLLPPDTSLAPASVRMSTAPGDSSVILAAINSDDTAKAFTRQGRHHVTTNGKVPL